jgi:hypothetical protein
MTSEIISWIAVGLIFAASTVMLINLDWRTNLGALAILYLAAFLLITHHMPFIMASTKLITGWMVVTALGMTRLSLQTVENENGESFWPRGQWFRLILMCIVVIVTIGSTPRIEAMIPGLGLPVIAGGLMLIGAGVLQLGVTSNLLSMILGLLILLAGFEIIYAAVESSILVAGLLSITSLGLSLTGSYLMIAGSFPHDVEEEL